MVSVIPVETCALLLNKEEQQPSIIIHITKILNISTIEQQRLIVCSIT